MRYYAHFGHKDFILCLGYKGDRIKKYFLEYDETVSNDFVISEGGKKIDLLARGIHDWKITFVDTGLNANVGMCLKAVQPFVEGEEMFLANYSDGVDLPLPDMIGRFRQTDATACFVGFSPTQTFHLVSLEDGGRVKSIRHVEDVGMRVNGGFFVLRGEIFDSIKPGEELVQEPFQRLAAAGKLLPIPTTASGSVWTPSRTSNCSKTCTRGARSRGRSGSRIPRRKSRRRRALRGWLRESPR